MTRYVVADRVGVVELGDDVYVAHLPEGPIVSLTGTAAIVWRAALDDSAHDVADRVAVASGLPSADIAADVATFVRELVTWGLLVQADPGGY